MTRCCKINPLPTCIFKRLIHRVGIARQHNCSLTRKERFNKAFVMIVFWLYEICFTCASIEVIRWVNVKYGFWRIPILYHFKRVSIVNLDAH